MIQYILIKENHLDEFESQINTHLSNGLRLFGDTKILINAKGDFIYFQTMLKIDGFIN